MSKSLMILNTPKSCEECNLCVAVLGKYYCAAKGIHIAKGERDCSCPLVAVPEKLDTDSVKGAMEYACGFGWNECLNRILGGSSGNENER